jgi:dTDP-4-amino-4,6-dideoxygalactose transaminase
LATFSFHETKNLGCGEGGALVVNRPEWVERARFLQEKGTDRSLVLQGVRSKYGWVDKGSSFLLSDILAAMLYAQLQSVETIVIERAKITRAYQELFEPYENAGVVKIPHSPEDAIVNHHAFFVIFDTTERRGQFLSLLREYDVHAYIGYVPLHSFKMGMSFGYEEGDLPVTDDVAKRIVRLPFYTDLASNGLDYCVEAMAEVMRRIYG